MCDDRVVERNYGATKMPGFYSDYCLLDVDHLLVTGLNMMHYLLLVYVSMHNSSLTHQFTNKYSLHPTHSVGFKGFYDNVKNCIQFFTQRNCMPSIRMQHQHYTRIYAHKPFTLHKIKISFYLLLVYV